MSDHENVILFTYTFSTPRFFSPLSPPSIFQFPARLSLRVLPQLSFATAVILHHPLPLLTSPFPLPPSPPFILTRSLFLSLPILRIGLYSKNEATKNTSSLLAPWRMEIVASFWYVAIFTFRSVKPRGYTVVAQGNIQLE